MNRLFIGLFIFLGSIGFVHGGTHAAPPNRDVIVTRAIWRSWPMRIVLSDLGAKFTARQIAGGTAIGVAISDWADRRLMSSGYAERSTLLFGEVNPPRCAQISPACGDARNCMSARAAGVSFNITATSPPTTSPLGPEMLGKSK